MSSQNLPVLAVVLLALNCVTFLAYGRDKWAAVRGGDRTAERRLLLLSLAGGWPAALVALRVFRHKRRKASFMMQLWSCVALNVTVVAYLLTRST